MKLGPRIAIDFGTTRTKVAYYDPEREEAKLVPLGIAQREIIPSVFYVPKIGSGEILVGDDAMAQLDVDPAGIVREIKREIDKLGKRRCGVGRLAPTRVELAAALLRMIRRRCEEGVFHGCRITRCTLTVPVAFTESQRLKLVEASNQAGFTDVRLMDEPTAAARAWLEKRGERLGEHVVVVDIGGGTTDFSVVEWSNDRFVPHTRVLPEGFSQGGNDIDDIACEELLSQQDEEDERDVLRIKDSFLVKLRGIKEQFTRGLKSQSIPLGSTMIDIQPEVFRAAENEFVNRLRDKLQMFFDRCKAGGVESPVVLLVGGASKMPGLPNVLRKMCPNDVLTWDAADFATVLGAVDYPGKELGFESAKQRKAQASYVEALKATMADDVISTSEYAYLMQRREELGISVELATKLELNVIGRPIGKAHADGQVSRSEVDELISDGRSWEAAQRTTKLMIESPDIDAFELWIYSIEPLCDIEQVMRLSRSVLATRGDLWGRCCVAWGLSAVGRCKEAAAYFSSNIKSAVHANRGQITAANYTELYIKSDRIAKSPSLQKAIPKMLAVRPHSAFVQEMFVLAISESDSDLANKIATDLIRRSPLSISGRIVKLCLDIAADRLNGESLDEHCQVLDRICREHWISRFARALKAVHGENYRLALKELDGVAEHAFLREMNDWRSVIYFMRANCRLQLGEVPEAKRDVLESVGCCPESPALFLHAEFLSQEMRYAEAKAAYQAALAQEPSNIAALNGLGWCHLHLRSFDAGKEQFITAVRLDVTNADSHFGLITSVAHKHFVNDGKLFFFPNIPDDKAANAVSSYAGHHGGAEPGRIVILYDDTFWGSAKSGLSISCNGLTFKDQSGTPRRLGFSEIHSVTVESFLFDKKLKINGVHEISVISAANPAAVASALRNVLLELGDIGRHSLGIVSM